MPFDQLRFGKTREGVIAGSSRFEFYIQPDDKELIEAAATIMNQSVSDFARAAVLDRAKEILQRQEETIVPSDFFDALLRGLDEPPVPNERSVRAA